MLVIIGHGPSIVGKALGGLIDASTVIRLKGAPMPDPEDWGARTDYLSTTKPHYCSDTQAERWIFGPPTKGYRHADVDRWLAYFEPFRTSPKRRKPSNGLCAVFCAVEFLNPDKIGVIGFDSILRPEVNTGKWHDTKPGKWSHDSRAENAAIHGLGVEIIDLCS